MKSRFKKLLKGIFVSSVTSIVATTGANGTNYDINKLTTNNDGNTNKLEFSSQKENSAKFILKIKGDNSYKVLAHRSHRSHSSHRSHRSSSSSYTPRSSGSSRSNSSSANSYTPPATSNKKTTTTPTAEDKKYNLGDRVLKKGMTGTDVAQLKNYLIAKKYLTGSLAKGKILFDLEIENAVKAFQKKIGLDADGVVGADTALFIKKQD